jgi:hypothetical protein
MRSKEEERSTVPGNDPSAYGEAVGVDYDMLYPEGGLDTDDAVTMLARLARRGLRESVLEFGVGTVDSRSSCTSAESG